MCVLAGRGGVGKLPLRQISYDFCILPKLCPSQTVCQPTLPAPTFWHFWWRHWSWLMLSNDRMWICSFFPVACISFAVKELHYSFRLYGYMFSMSKHNEPRYNQGLPVTKGTGIPVCCSKKGHCTTNGWVAWTLSALRTCKLNAMGDVLCDTLDQRSLFHYLIWVNMKVS